MAVTCAALVDELRGSKSWYVSAAFFELPAATRRGLDIQVRLDERAISTLIWPARRSLIGSGYRTRNQYAQRSLRGLRELNAEITRLEQIADATRSFSDMPSRGPRARGAARGPVAPLVLRCMRQRTRWSWKHVRMTRRSTVRVGDRVWDLTAWCYAMLDEDVPPLDVGMMLSMRQGRHEPAESDYAAALRTLRRPFTGRRYRVLDAHQHGLVLVTRALSTLGEARRERAHIDLVAANLAARAAEIGRANGRSSFASRR